MASNFLNGFRKIWNTFSEAVDKDGNNALIVAAARGNLETVQELLRNNGGNESYINARNKKGRNFFLVAAENGNDKVVAETLNSAALLGLGIFNAVISAKDNRDCNALMLAASRGQLAVVKLILDSAPQVGWEIYAGLIKARDNSGSNALMLAAVEGRVEVVREFLQSRKTRVGIMDSNLYHELVTAMDRGGNIFMLAATNNQPEIVGEILKNREALGDDLYFETVNARDSSGRTALMLAAIDGHIPVLRTMLDFVSGANDERLQEGLLLARDNDGRLANTLTANTEASQLLDEAIDEASRKHETGINLKR